MELPKDSDELRKLMVEHYRLLSEEDTDLYPDRADEEVLRRMETHLPEPRSPEEATYQRESLQRAIGDLIDMWSNYEG